MSFNTTFCRLERLALLIKRKRTGTIKELSSRLSVSPRTVDNDLRQLRDWGADIKYCKSNNTFYYGEPINIDFKVFRAIR